MKRRDFLKKIAFGAAAITLAPKLLQGQSAEKLNFIYILADDLGYGDVNLGLDELDVFKNPHVRTPNLARLAGESIVFTHHYASSPVCSPSRAGLLTGRTPTRCNINLWISDLTDNDKMFLSGGEITIAEVLKKAGYTTAVIGKWHLNGADWEKKENWTGWTGSFPNQQGFDYAMVSKENPHETRKLRRNSQEDPGDFFLDTESVHGEPLGTIKGFSSQIITDTAIDWLKYKRDKSKPFFLYLPYDAVHEKIVNPVEYNSLYNTGDYKKDKYYANVTYLDAQIGRVLDALDALRLTHNTVVFFSSDNGPEVLDSYRGSPRSYGTACPLHGQKKQLFEGGIRVPGMVRWPGHIKHRVSQLPNSNLDVMPTTCELAGVQPPKDRPLDGTSIVGHLLEDKQVQRRVPLYWQFERRNQNWQITGTGYNRRYDGKVKIDIPTPKVVVRQDNYVLRGYYKGQAQPYSLPTKYELYDVVNDPAEATELSHTKPEIFTDLRDKLEKMHADVNKERMKTALEIERRINQNI